MLKSDKTLRIAVAALVFAAVALCYLGTDAPAQSFAAGSPGFLTGAAGQLSTPAVEHAGTAIRTSGAAMAGAGGDRLAPDLTMVKCLLKRADGLDRASESHFTPPLRI